MVRVSALFLLAFGLACAISVRSFSLEDLEQDMDDFELTEVNQAIEMSNRLRNIATIIQEAEEIDAQSPEKRFLNSNTADFFKKIKDFFTKGLNKVGDFFKNLYQKAKDAWQAKVKNISFKSVVDKLMPLIEDNTSEEGCTRVCNNGAHKILGPDANLGAELLCGYACHGAIAKIHELSGHPADDE